MEYREAYESAPAGSPAAARAAWALGRELAERYFKRDGSEADRDEAVELLDEALGVPLERPSVVHVGLALLLFFRVMPMRPGPDAQGEGAMALAGALMSGALNDPRLFPDRDRALAHLRWVLRHEPADSEVVPYAEALVAMLGLVGAGNPLAMIAALASVAPRVAGGLAPMADLLTGVAGERPPEVLLPAFDRVLDQLPAGHRLRPIILAEAGALLARRGHVDGLPDQLAGLAGAWRTALAQVRDDDPGRETTIRRLTGILLTATAYTGDPDGVADIVATADRLVAEGGGRERFLRGMALTLRGRLNRDPADLRAAVDDLRAALAAVDAGDDLRPAMTGMLGALLNDRYLDQGVIADAEAGAELLAGGDLVAAGLLSRAILAVQRRDAGELDAVIDGLATTQRPDDYPWRSRLDAALGLAHLARASRPGDVETGLSLLRRAGDELAVEMTGRPALRAAGAAAAVLDGIVRDDDRAVAEAATRLDEIVGETSPDQVALLALSAQIHFLRYEREPSAADLAGVVARFERAAAALDGVSAHPLAAHVHAQRSEALHLAGETAAAAASGLAALRAFGDDVLLQTGTAHAVESARRAAGFARRIADRCLAAGRPEPAFTALELGRGLVLHSAMTTASVPARLRAAGHGELAAEWESAPPGSGQERTFFFAGGEPRHHTGLDQGVNTSATTGRHGLADTHGADAVAHLAGATIVVPSDLRPRVLSVLRERFGAGALAAVPSPAEAGAAAGADLVVYLLGGHDEVPGRLLTVRPDGGLEVVAAPGLRLDHPALVDYLAAHDRHSTDVGDGTWRACLAAVCDWAWEALIVPLGEPGSVVLIPLDALAYVPWHAARTAGPRYAVERFAFSYAASVRQLAAVTRRPPATGQAVLLADRTSSLPVAPEEVAAVRATSYPEAVVLDHARPGDLMTAVAGNPAVLHLACHARTDRSADCSHLALAGESLTVARILAEGGPGGLVVLSACSSDLTVADHDEALTLATAFLAAGATSVVGSRWSVDDRTTACLMVMFHHYRTAEKLADRDALRKAQLWMADRDRKVPAALESTMPTLMKGCRTAMSEPSAWAPFIHQGGERRHLGG
ncbi:CHAT domain-containing protein [Actinoplanes sp. NPDC089786]|uniref:CHAT domain-containing protein n=1 Tax=Actinoplanes sp. NPDC089786 TaxID=3155185 RepID=UPI00343AC712